MYIHWPIKDGPLPEIAGLDGLVALLTGWLSLGAAVFIWFTVKFVWPPIIRAIEPRADASVPPRPLCGNPVVGGGPGARLFTEW